MSDNRDEKTGGCQELKGRRNGVWLLMGTGPLFGATQHSGIIWILYWSYNLLNTLKVTELWAFKWLVLRHVDYISIKAIEI